MPGSGTIRRDDEPTNADLRAVMLDVREKVNHVHKIITGGEKPEDGLIVQVDRLKQDSERRKVWVGAAVATAVASGVGWLFSAITGHR